MSQALLEMTDHPASRMDISQAELEQREVDDSPPAIWNRVEEVVENNPVERIPGIESQTGTEINYVQTVRYIDAYRACQIFKDQNVDRIYSFGAGDCRAELYLAEEGFDVVAYELNPKLATIIRQEFNNENFELRQEDYHTEFEQLIDQDIGYLIIGGNNEPPRIPQQGILIEGYSEIGIRAYENGTPLSVW